MNPSSIAIRLYGPADLPAIIAIANRAWRGINDAYRQAYGEELCNLLFPHPETRAGNNVRADIEKHPDQTFVGEENGRIVAFCNFILDEQKRIGTVGYNAVDPDCGLRGVGQQMYRAVLDEFRRRGMSYAAVLTGLDDGHVRARRAYERAGFNISHGTVTYYMKL